MEVPSKILFRYFEKASNHLQRLTEDLATAITVANNTSQCSTLPNNPNLDWHRNRILHAQMTSLDEVLSEWEHQWDGSPIDREAFQCVLRKIGHGDFSHVVFDDRRTKKGDKVADSQSTSSLGLRLRNSKSVDVGRSATLHISSPQNEESLDEEERKEQQRLITEAMEQTNDMARMAFARSVLFLEWWLDRPKSQEKLAPPQPRDNARGRYGKLRGHNSAEDSFDRSSVLEYCGLMMTAVRLSEIQKYLRSEADPYSRPRFGFSAVKNRRSQGRSI